MNEENIKNESREAILLKFEQWRKNASITIGQLEDIDDIVDALVDLSE